mgnify:CR=1 FL=1
MKPLHINMSGFFLYLLFLSLPTGSFDSPNSNEIKGSFAYETDIKKSELYIINNNLEFNTYSLDSGILKSSIQIITDDSEKLENKTWGGLYDSFKLTPRVLNGLMREVTLKKIDGRFFLFHDGGGLIIEILGENLVRKDNSFPFMNKFFGDFRSYDKKIYHFGGYGLFRSNNALLLFDEGNSNQWDEVTFKNGIPDEIVDGIASFSSLIIDSDYYIIGGNSSINNDQFFNQSILKFDFNNYEWSNLGDINLDLSNNPTIIASETCFYVFDSDFYYEIKISKGKIVRYNYKKDFNIQSIGSKYPYSKENKTFVSIDQRDNRFGVVNMHHLDNKYIHTFKPHNGKNNTSLLNKYKLTNIIDLSSEKIMPLYKIEQSRNQFFIPVLIVISILIINVLYRGFRKEKVSIPTKLYSFKNDELLFLNTKINLENNSLEIIKMLHEKDSITSNEIVARLVENGLSYDYASKVKNKIIESLNEKFEFITGSTNQFINIAKSPQDKRIQILSILRD